MRHSTLFWRVATCIFASILLIEGVLLAYSYTNERERLVSRIGDSVHLFVSSLDIDNPIPQLTRLTGSDDTHADTHADTHTDTQAKMHTDTHADMRVVGFLHISSGGVINRSGDMPVSLLLALDPHKSTFDNHTNTIVSRHDREVSPGITDTLVLRLDANWIVSYMQQYVWRILGMVMVISFFVTFVCLAFLKPMLVDPLRRLEKLLTFNPTTGIKEATVQDKDENRSDELGAVFRSFTQLRHKVTEAEAQLEHQANHDELTNLSNRRSMYRFLQSQVDNYANNGTACSLLMLDLDHFKEVNDTAGHAAGDSLLTSIASLLQECTHKDSLVARQGGDEFSIVLPGLKAQEANDIAETIRKRIDNKVFVWEKTSFSIAASIGIAEISQTLSSKEALIVAADNACIEAKRLGKNYIFIHDDLNQSQMTIDALWVNRIINSLDHEKFTLFKQSITRINTHAPSEHFEILLRMQDPEGGFFSPADFLPVAERNGLMPTIDQWVVNRAVDWLSQQQIKGGRDYCMNINISALSLADADFRQFLKTKVQKTQHLNPYICFEITESAAMTHYDQTVTLLNSLKEMGCRVALDDFGTGFSSLSQIRKLPLDYIKIDGSFVKEIYTNALDQTVVRSVAEIAKVLSIETVAEYVDNEAALHMLKTMGIDYAQGFLFSQPHALIEGEQQSIKKAA